MTLRPVSKTSICVDCSSREGGGLVDGPVFRGVDRALVVDGLPEHVEHPAQGGLPDRDRDGGSGIIGHHAPAQTIRGVHGDTADHTAAQVLLHLQHQPVPVPGDLDRVIDIGELLGRELHIHHVPHDLHDPTHRALGHPCPPPEFRF